MDATLRTLATAPAIDEDEAAFRKAVVDSLKELMVTAMQLREQNAAWAAHHEETQRRLAALESAREKQQEKAEQRAVDRLKQRIEMDWKVLSLGVSVAVNLFQIVIGPHVTFHW